MKCGRAFTGRANGTKGRFAGEGGGGTHTVLPLVEERGRTATRDNYNLHWALKRVLE